MSLDDLIAKIKHNEIGNYYKEILTNHIEIIDMVAETSQGTVAIRLAMSPTKFSAIYNLLLAYKELDNADS